MPTIRNETHDRERGAVEARRICAGVVDRLPARAR
jgi:hypothetical protein